MAAVSGPSPWTPSGRYLAGSGRRSRPARCPRWLNAGAYVIERGPPRRIPPDRPCSLERDVFPAAIAEGLRIAAYRCPHPFFDIGTGEDYHRFVQLYSRWSENFTPGP